MYKEYNKTKSIIKENCAQDNTKFKITPVEVKILNILREKKSRLVNILIRDGFPIRVEIEEELTNKASNAYELEDLIKEKEFQEITLIRRHGRNLLVKRREPILLRELEQVS